MAGGKELRLSQPFSMLDLALAGQVLVWLCVILAVFVTRQASIYHPLSIYLLFHGLVFVARPLLVHYMDFDREWHYMRFEPTELQFLRTLGASSLGLIVFSAAALAFGWCHTEFQTPTARPFTAE